MEYTFRNCNNADIFSVRAKMRAFSPSSMMKREMRLLNSSQLCRNTGERVSLPEL